jgi:hypothetical protein
LPAPEASRLVKIDYGLPLAGARSATNTRQHEKMQTVADALRLRTNFVMDRRIGNRAGACMKLPPPGGWR